MNQEQKPKHDQISWQDWEKTPASVKLLVETMEQGLEQLEPRPGENPTPDMSLTDHRELLIIMPVFNDWAALDKLLLLIERITLPEDINLKVLVIDDYSTQPIPKFLIHQDFRQIRTVNILRLRRNLGDQRAIAVGLCYVYHNLKCDVVAVMDGDGEDNPSEIERLLHIFEQAGHNKIVFARRSRRSESRTFKLFYFIYKKIYKLLIGREFGVGNFSFIPASLLGTIVVVSEIWNHYSSGIYRSKIPYIEVDVPRTKRLSGKSSMNLVSLVTYGLSSIAVYGDIVGTRILLSVVVLLVVLLLTLLVVIITRVFTDFAIPGWASYVSGLLTLSLLQLILLGTVFSIIILSARNQYSFIPIRDYKYFVDRFINLV